MFAEWTAECSNDDPVIVAPWVSADHELAFVNLRTNPYDLAEIREADRFPALGRALRALNAARSPFFTAKCDVWPLAPEEDEDALESTRLELMLDEGEAAAGLRTYIDLIWRERIVFASAHQQTDRLERLVRRAEKLEHAESALQFVLRPALLDFGSPLEGFATTVYVTALAPDIETATARLASALEDAVELLRAREFEPGRGSATIDI